MKSCARYASVLLFALLLSACGRSAEPQLIQGQVFGTFYEVTLGAQHSNADIDELKAGITATLDEVDRQMSTYRDDSVLNQLNQAELGEAVTVDDEIFYVLARSEAIASMSGGAFDHTVGGLVNLWGFGPEGRVTSRPNEDTLQQRLSEVGYHYVILDESAQSVTRTSDVFVDLSGIAKGYGADAVSAYLLSQGIHNHLVNIGGDIMTRGTRNDGQRWRIGIEAPRDSSQVVQHIMPIEDIAMVTSGDYRNYFEEDGVRYSHTIDPTTGEPISHDLASVTVLADNATDADGYATALMVLGTERGLEFANRHDIAVLLIYRDGDGFASVMSERFQRDHEDSMTVPRVQ